MSENNFIATISLDMRKHRIRIYKTTLNLLGPPKYIQLLVNPKKRILAIRGLDERCNESHVVSFTHLKPDNSYELYSKHLIDTLMSLLTHLEKDYTYRLFGEVHNEENTAFFSFNTIQRIEGGN